MKKLLVLLLAAALVMPFCACKEKIPDEIYTSEIKADWPYYNTAEKLIGASSDVFEGTITDIFFDLEDNSGKNVSEIKNPKSSELHLRTVFEIEVTKRYSGVKSEKMYISVGAGKSNYKLDEQYKLMKKYGVQRETVPIFRELDEFKIGDKYIFCTVDFGVKYDRVVNLSQFALSLDSDTAREIREYFEND